MKKKVVSNVSYLDLSRSKSGKATFGLMDVGDIEERIIAALDLISTLG